jgi:hypothetical protein
MTQIKRALMRVGFRHNNNVHSSRAHARTVETEISNLERRFSDLQNYAVLAEREHDETIEIMTTNISRLQDIMLAIQDAGLGCEDDIWIVCASSRFSVNKTQASLCSDWFHAVTNSGMREQSLNEVHLNDVDAPTSSILRLAMYLGPVKIAAMMVLQVVQHRDSAAIVVL